MLVSHPLSGKVQPEQAIIDADGPPRMGKQPTGSGGEPSSPNCETSAEIRLVNFALQRKSQKQNHLQGGFFMSGIFKKESYLP